MLILVAVVPLVAALFFAVALRRAQLTEAQDYSVQSPMVLITLGLPVALTVLVMALVGMSGNFDSFAGLALILGVKAGRNLRDFIHCQLRNSKPGP